MSGYDDSTYVIFGVPFDQTSSFRRGSKLAPQSIRQAYTNLESFDPFYGVNYTDAGISDLGDLTEEEDAETVMELVKSVVSGIRKDGKIPIMLGGEHSITTGAVHNFKNASMIIIDAHSDFRDTYFGNKYNHACVTRRCLEILGENRIFSVGTRSVSEEEYNDPDFKKVTFYSSREVHERSITAIADEISKLAGDEIYFSIDMDGLDPSVAPGVGTPEPYGLTDTDVRYLLNKFAKKVVGLDIVEMTPVYDNGNTAMLAAKLIQDFIGSRETKKEKLEL